MLKDIWETELKANINLEQPRSQRGVVRWETLSLYPGKGGGAYIHNKYLCQQIEGLVSGGL